MTAWVRAFKFLKLEETLPALFDGRITDRNPHNLVCPFQVRESILGLQVPKVGGNTSRSLRWKDYRPEPPQSGLPIPSKGVDLDGLGQGLQVPKVVEDTGVTLPLSSVEGLQIGTPQFGSSGLPIPSRELGLTAWVRAFKFLKWWSTPVSPSRSVGLDGLGQGLQVPKVVVEDTGVTLSLSSVEGLQTGTPISIQQPTF